MSTSSRRLLLVRHGPSAHVHDGSWINLASTRRFEELYDAASIRAGAMPPTELLRRAAAADVILASDLVRAVASAHALSADRPPVVSALLREVPFDIPHWGPRLPVNVWDALHHLMWTTRLLSGFENPETRRARAAAEWIDGHAAAAALTIAVTHGGFRRLLTVALTRRGWTPERGRRRYHNWSAWELSRS